MVSINIDSKKPLTQLEIAMLYNLCFYKNKNGWKLVKEIDETRKKIKETSDYSKEKKEEFPGGDTKMPGVFIYNSPKTTYYKQIDNLVKIGIAESGWHEYKDNKNRILKKKEYRLKRKNPGAFKALVLIGLYDKHLRKKYQSRSVMYWFNKTPYFNDPKIHLLIQPEVSAATTMALNDHKKRTLLEIEQTLYVMRIKNIYKELKKIKLQEAKNKAGTS